MRKFLVNGNVFEEVQEVINYITDNGDFDDSYDMMLDECYEEINVCGYTFNPSYALKELDLIVYNCGKNDYIDSLTYDLDDTIDRMSNGDIEDFYGVEVECINDLSDAPQPNDYDNFTEFCQDCDNCMYHNCPSLQDCEQQFNADKLK